MADRLGVVVRTDDAPLGVSVAELAGLALRHNRLRAHLLVSTVLGKHHPADPRLVLGAGRLLGEQVGRLLRGEPGSAPCGRLLGPALRAEPGAALALLAATGDLDPARTARCTVLGYAETATGLGHAVAAQLGGRSLHSTRRRVDGAAVAAGFEEEHSHATGHLLLPDDTSLLAGREPLVLVDDELSTGRTALNTIVALHRRSPRERYVVAALVDVRSAADRERLDEAARALSTRIDVVALASGAVDLPDDVLQRAQVLLDQVTSQSAESSAAQADAPGRTGVTLRWPRGVRDGGRHGFDADDEAALVRSAAAVAESLAAAIRGGDVLVLGCEELMHAPVHLAVALADRLELARPGARVRFSSTTRSPVLPVDAPGYAVRQALAFAAHDDPTDGSLERFAYNVNGSGGRSRCSDVVLVVDQRGDSPALHAGDGLLARLRERADVVHLVVLPVTPPGARAEHP